jgi:hypothetical protein
MNQDADDHQRDSGEENTRQAKAREGQGARLLDRSLGDAGTAAVPRSRRTRKR